MKTSLEAPPRTLLQVFKSLPEGTRVQLIEDHLVMSPAPLDRHQKIIVKLVAQLETFITQNNLGEVRISAYDV